jgi:DNA topoisomerase-2
LEQIKLKTFIDTELKTFSNEDNVRSIPSIIDGFKDSQRKAVYGLLRSGGKEIKLSQLASQAALWTHYTHGDDGLAGAIVGMAQTFPGTNNINLFEPIGQFGSRISPRPSASRYIYTKPTPYLRTIIRKEDDGILVPRTEEGYEYEPINYFPTIPLWLVNGVSGIGTGHSVEILPRNPKKVIQLITKLLDGKPMTKAQMDKYLVPSFGDWSGTVEAGETDRQWVLTGKLTAINTTKLLVTELPIGYDVAKFKKILIALMDKGVVKDYDANCTEEAYEFTVTVPRETTSKYSIEELYKLFKLVVRVSDNVTLWDTQGKLRPYDTVADALIEFVEFQKTKYAKSKQNQLDELQTEINWLNARITFTNYWNNKLKNPHKKSREELTTELSGVVDPSYIDRLMGLQISSLTMEKIQELQKQTEQLVSKYDTLTKTSIEQLYKNDLGEIK